jgi:hypothetical protein
VGAVLVVREAAASLKANSTPIRIGALTRLYAVTSLKVPRLEVAHDSMNVVRGEKLRLTEGGNIQF